MFVACGDEPSENYHRLLLNMKLNSIFQLLVSVFQPPAHCFGYLSQLSSVLVSVIAGSCIQ